MLPSIAVDRQALQREGGLLRLGINSGSAPVLSGTPWDFRSYMAIGRQCVQYETGRVTNLRI